MHERILLFLPLPVCIATTIAILLHDYCAIHDHLPTPLSYAMNHTKLILAISCKGQAMSYSCAPSASANLGFTQSKAQE